MATKPTTNAPVNCADLLKAVGDETRLAVLRKLLDGPQHVGQINEDLKIEQSLLSHHLKVLRDSSLVVAVRDGKAVRYQLAPGVEVSRQKKVINMGCCKLSFD